MSHILLRSQPSYLYVSAVKKCSGWSIVIVEKDEGLIINVFVKPRSKEFKVTFESNEIVVYCTEEPVKGKVNRELIKGLQKLFGRQVELVAGFTSRQKTLLVRGATKSDLEHVLLQR